MGRISKCRRYVIDLTVLESLSLRKLGVGFIALVTWVLLDVVGR